jgi:hypothetical protein
MPSLKPVTKRNRVSNQSNDVIKVVVPMTKSSRLRVITIKVKG